VEAFWDRLCTLQLQCRQPVRFRRVGSRPGWCSAAAVLDVRSGDVDGTDVNGTKTALGVDWPSGMLAGNGTGRLYFDSDVSQEQRSALESVFRGQQGGIFELFAGLIPDVLPSREAPSTSKRGKKQRGLK
jgi:hypothetical protein